MDDLDLEGDGISVNRDAIGDSIRVLWDGVSICALSGESRYLQLGGWTKYLVGLAEVRVPSRFRFNGQ